MKQVFIEVFSAWQFLLFVVLSLLGLWYLAEPSTVLYIVSSVLACCGLVSAYLIFNKKSPLV